MIYIYDHVARRVNEIALPAIKLDNYGFSSREIAVLKPLALALMEVQGMSSALALDRLQSLTWGFKRRMIGEGHVIDIRVSFEVSEMLTPNDPERVALFVKFLCRTGSAQSESRFVLALGPFDLPDHKAVAKL